MKHECTTIRDVDKINMNRTPLEMKSRILNFITILRAYYEGKTISYKRKDSISSWHQLPPNEDIDWCLASYDYRIE